MSTPRIREKIASLPKEPGCYLMKDSLSRIIYVGKAKNLRSRVSQYFTAEKDSYKTQVLVSHIADFELIITQTEVEALLLERTLIKHHKPRFNVLLRDDKEYPFLRINFQEPWPRIEKVRRRKDDGATYLGPFSSSGQLRVLVDAALRIFPVVRCSRHEFAHVRRPCNYYNMKLCLGPCKLPVAEETYKSTVQDAVDFLSGRGKQVLKGIEAKMTQAAQDEQFERAALYRDQLKAFAAVTERQNVVMHEIADADVVGLVQSELKSSFHVLTVRNFQLVGQDSFVLRSEIADPEEALEQFLLQYYESRSLPKELLLPISLSSEEHLRLALLAGHPDTQNFSLQIPGRGGRKELVEMAQKNASYKLTELAVQAENSRTELLLLQDKLRLHEFPKRIECIDISNTQGTGIVASNVCFVDGKPSKALYRHYHIKTVQGGPDDFRSMAEVVQRRLERGLRDDDLPNLLVVDGGKGQLSSAWKVVQEFQQNFAHSKSLFGFDLVALAKAKGQTPQGGRTRHGPLRAFERVFFIDQEMPLVLSPGTPEYRLLTQIRDEAHRFAITHHRKVRSKKAVDSSLTEILGIGSKMQKKLLTHFGSLERLKQATLDELSLVKGLRKTSAVALHSHFQNLLESTDAVGALKTDQITFELTLRLAPSSKHHKKDLIQFVEERGFTDYIEAMIDGISDPLPRNPEELWNDHKPHLNEEEKEGGHMALVNTAPLALYHQERQVLEDLVQQGKGLFGDELVSTIVGLEDQSWQQAWREEFQEIRTSRFLVVTSLKDEGHLDQEDKREGNPLEEVPTIRLMSGEAFGDGRHGTTQVCLELMSELSSLPSSEGGGFSMLDLGTGNGVLALAAGILGYDDIVVTDLSQEILDEALQHFQLNIGLMRRREISQGLPHPWTAVVTDQVPPAPNPQGYHLITANILAPVLHDLLPDMVKALDPLCGQILLAGFIRKEREPLVSRAISFGLQVLAEKDCRGWVGLLLGWAKKPSV